MLTKTFVVSAARKLCLSWTGTVSKPGVTQMTSWPGWAAGTDLGDLGAGRMATAVTPLRAGWMQQQQGFMTSCLRTWCFVCLPGSGDLGTNEPSVALFVPSTVERSPPHPSRSCYSCELSMQQNLREFMCASFANWWRFSSQMPWFSHIVSKLMTFWDLFFFF